MYVVLFVENIDKSHIFIELISLYIHTFREHNGTLDT